MTERKPPRSFASQLLARADGTLPSPPPRVQPYFSGENGRTQPAFDEITREKISRPAVPQEQRHGAPNTAANASGHFDLPPRAHAEHAPAARIAERQDRLADNFRLAEPVRPSRATPLSDAYTPAVSETAVGRGSDTDQTTTRRVDDPAAGTDAGKLVTDAVDRPTEQRASQPEQSALRPPDLQAAIAQLLGETAEAAPAPSVTINSGTTQPPRNEPKVEAEPSPTASSEDSSENDARPITIHIGEIVVAPENPPPAATHKRKAWTPPVSIDEYRARRAKEWG